MTWTFNRAAHTLTHLPINGVAWTCEARGEAAPGSNGPLAAGTYTLAAPLYNDPGDAELVAEGPYFVPVNGTPGRTGIGIHGGGTGTAHPLAARQGWVVTFGCIRVQNVDLYHLALNVGDGDELVVL